MESWQVYRIATKTLPPGFLRRLYSRSYGLIQTWAAGPMNEIRNRNPIDRVRDMLKELDMMGRGDVARAAIDMMAEPLGGHFAFDEKQESDKGSLDGEIADATVALGQFSAVCRDAIADGRVTDGEMSGIIDACRALKRELAQVLDAVRAASDSGDRFIIKRRLQTLCEEEPGGGTL